VIRNRIHILGAAGAGKSALGAAVAEQLGCEQVDTDDVYWLPTELPYREKRPADECVALLRERLTAARRFILTGSLSGWGDAIVRMLDAVVLLETPVEIRLQRLRTRERQRYAEALDRVAV
jgi:cytidylate kinase